MRIHAVTYRVMSLSLALGLALAGAMAAPFPEAKVDANGFTVPVAKGISGPYEYLVGIWPPEPVVGRLHMAISLTSAKIPVTDAEVLVTGSVGATQGDPAPAFSYFLHPWSYELDMVLDEPGTWDFEIEIVSPLGGAAIEIVLEVGSGEGSVEQTTGEFAVTATAAPPEPAPSGAATTQEPTQREDPDIEALHRMMTRQAPAKPTQDQPATRDTTLRGDARPGGVNQGGWFNWVLVGIPLVFLALGLGVWALNRRQPATPRSGTAHRISRNRPRGPR